MKFKEYSALHKRDLENFLLTYLNEKLHEYAKQPLYAESVQKIIEAVTGGKLVRGTLILLAYESKKNKITIDALRLAAAFELLHTALLIQDDIMDNDMVRRGKPTVFAKSINDGINIDAKNSREYGNAIAICISNIAIFMAYECIGNITKATSIHKILQASAHEIQKVGFAQIADVHYGQTDTEPTEDEILNIYRFKTARYTFSLPLKLGGMLADFDYTTLSKLENFGEELGISFQIKDDELGIYGDEKITGKPIGTDIRENKKTLLRLALYTAADAETKKILNKLYGKTTLNENELATINTHMQRYELLSQMQRIRDEKSSMALTILDSIDIPEKFKYILADLVEFINNRDK